MKAKTIKAVIRKKVDEWIDSISDDSVKALVKDNIVVTGGCIASMLLKENVNDYDIYFTNKATTKAVAEYYVNSATFGGLLVSDEEGRVRITTETGHRGETAGEAVVVNDSGEIEEINEKEEAAAQSNDSGGYKAVFFSTNAITLTGKIQLILRFYGEPDEIHENYDFVHCTNYWTSRDGELVLRPAALEALITKELRYVGSLYPVCSIIRLRKFINRGWSVNAGQILKMTLQASELDLTDPKVLEDQLTGVDALYFQSVIEEASKRHGDKLDMCYLVEIIDRMF